MKTLIVVLNVASFVASFGAILWAWFVVRKDMESNAALLARLRAIDAAHAERVVALPGGLEDTEKKFADYREAGKTMFTYGDIQHAPEMVKALIYTHAASGLGPQVALVGMGLLAGLAANIWSLYLPA
jgi:hypothetical protein